jgi:dTDP-4-dehydrorhamnose 3,5-epimerase
MQKYEFASTALDGVVEIRSAIRQDNRGFAREVFSAEHFSGAAIGVEWALEAEFRCPQPYVLRGFHYPLPPFRQDRLVRVIHGRAREVVADIDPASPTFLRHAVIDLDADVANQVFVPSRYAHGFVTLEPGSIVSIRFSVPHGQGSEAAIRFDDPQIGADWGLGGNLPVISERDAGAPLLAEWLAR